MHVSNIPTLVNLITLLNSKYDHILKSWRLKPQCLPSIWRSQSHTQCSLLFFFFLFLFFLPKKKPKNKKLHYMYFIFLFVIDKRFTIDQGWVQVLVFMYVPSLSLRVDSCYFVPCNAAHGLVQALDRGKELSRM